MQTKISNLALKQAFEPRLMRYALAGGALLAAPSAHADSIIYSGPLDLVASSAASLSVSFNPLAGDATDFTISAVNGTSASVTASPNTGDLFYIGPLDFGTSITLADTTSGATTLLSKVGSDSYSGPWANLGGAAYLGVEFTVASQQYLGWAELQMAQSESPTATLLGYAYNDQPGGAIFAGQTSSSTPEPSSLALFALGAAGVLALRSRRKAA